MIKSFLTKQVSNVRCVNWVITLCIESRSEHMRVLAWLWVSVRKGCRDRSPSNSEAGLCSHVRYCISASPYMSVLRATHTCARTNVYERRRWKPVRLRVYPCTFMTCMHLESRNSLNTPAGSDSKLYVSCSANLLYT